MAPSVPGRCGGRARVPCRFGAELFSDAAAADPARDAARRARRAAACWSIRCSIRPARGPPVPDTPNDRRNPLVRAARAGRGARARGSTPCSSPTCTPTTSTRPPSTCCPRTSRCSASRPTRASCATAASPTCGRSRTTLELGGHRGRPHRRPPRHRRDRRAARARVAASCCARPASRRLYVAGDTVWCDEVARGARRAPARRGGRQRRRRALHRAATRSR